jgi:hypothetical protein
VTPAPSPAGPPPVAAPTDSPAPSPAATAAPAPAVSPSPPTDSGGFQAGAPPAPVASPSPLPSSPSLSSSPPLSTASSSASASRQGLGRSSAGTQPSRLAPVGHRSGWRSRVARLLGILAVLVVLAAWSDGYGILGGRIRPLASPLRPPGPAPSGGAVREMSL